MIKVVAVLLGVAVIGGALYWVLSPFLLPMIGSTTLPSLFVTAQEKIQPIITYVQDNAWQVGSTVAAVTGIGAAISSKIYKANMQKKEIETTAQLTDKTREIINKEGEVLGLQNQLKDAKSTITTLKDNASNVAEITEQLKKANTQIDTLTTERNQLARLLPNVKDAEQLIKESKQVP